MQKTLWIVGRVHSPQNEKGLAVWEFFGVFNNQAKAIAACTGPDFFVGPALLNVRHPDEITQWPGCYYPKAGG